MKNSIILKNTLVDYNGHVRFCVKVRWEFNGGEFTLVITHIVVEISILMLHSYENIYTRRYRMFCRLKYKRGEKNGDLG